MEAIVLAGGQGTRLREIVADVPKPMAPINGRPFLELLLSQLAKNNFKRVIISIGYMGSAIRKHFNDNFMGMDISYVQEDVPLGTGGGVKLAMEKVMLDHVYIFNGDTFLDLEVNLVELQWEKNKRPIIIARKIENTSRYGTLLLKENSVIGFNEKSIDGPGMINAGCYVLKRNQLSMYQSDVAFSLEQDYLAKEVSKSTFDVFITKGKFIDIGVPDDYMRAQFELK
jgi:D-glycero-alpha-D-manno-heptose 1-phosphate guanylyltransferase